MYEKLRSVFNFIVKKGSRDERIYSLDYFPTLVCVNSSEY